MILGAALLVLVALGLFVGGIATGATALYWACVAVSVAAAVLLVLARRQVARPAAERSAPPMPPPARRVVPDTGPDDDEARLTPRDDDVPGGATATAADTASVTEDTPVRRPTEPIVNGEDEEPPVEEVEVTDLLLVMDLQDEVVVVDEHPRYHLADCVWLSGRTTIPLPLDEARTDGFTPCGRCAPDRHLAAVERERRAGKGAS